jgi:uncharacterized protein YjbI with pentapeptide repeats
MRLRLRSRSPWIAVTLTVVALVGVGIGLMTTAEPGQASRDIGVSLASGGVTGLVFIFAQSVMSQAEEHHRLLLRLSSSRDLTGTDLRDRYLARVALIGKKMAVADFSNAVLRASRLVGTDLTWSSFRDADLTGSILTNAKLDETDLRKSQLRHIDLRNVSLRNARLSGAILDYADLSGADLGQAILDGVHIGRIWYDEQTKWPPGFDPPTPDKGVNEIHRGRPDWLGFWAEYGRSYV